MMDEMNMKAVGPLMCSIAIIVTFAAIKAKDLSAPLWVVK